VVVPPQGHPQLSAAERPEPLAPEPPAPAPADPPPELEAGGEYDDVVVGPRDHSEAVLDGLRITRAELHGVGLTGTQLHDVAWRDVVLTGCELSGAWLAHATLTRVEVRESRGVGLVAIESAVVHARFVGCRLDGANFRATSFDQCVFERCSLVDADLSGARLARVEFDTCDMTRADLSGAAIQTTSLRGCTVDGLRGVASLRGATVTRDAVLPLAISAFGELGIVVADDAAHDSSGSS
jgi:uncharacterized protein YjbI with pentapeptide repeats